MTQVLRRRAKDSDDSPTPAGTPSAGTPSVGVMLMILTVAVLVVGVGAYALQHKLSQDEAIATARVDGLAAAESDAKDLLSYDYRTLDHDIGQAKSEMTARMARSFDAYWKVIRPSVVQGQVQMVTQVQAGGVIQASATHVSTLLFVQQISVNSAHPKQPQVVSQRADLSMEKVHGKWLVDGPLVVPPSSVPAASSPSPSASPSASASAKPSAGHH
jgi:Mce-associated membrane protein